MRAVQTARLADALLGATVDLQKHYAAQEIDAPLMPELLNCMCAVWAAAQNQTPGADTIPEQLRTLLDEYGFVLRLFKRTPHGGIAQIEELAARLREFTDYISRES